MYFELTSFSRYFVIFMSEHFTLQELFFFKKLFQFPTVHGEHVGMIDFVVLMTFLKTLQNAPISSGCFLLITLDLPHGQFCLLQIRTIVFLLCLSLLC